MKLIRRGDRSPAVVDLQVRLARLGYEISSSEAGGTFGPSTEAAVKAFQQQRGIVVDGIVGDVSWREVVESSWSLGDRLLRMRQPPLRGDDVRELQAHLNALGFDAGKHDGIFGGSTAQALRDFQRNLAIGEDGICGPQTVGALSSLRMVIKHGIGPRTREREARRAQPPGIRGKKVAVDPGHGGDDPGALGPSGEREADLAFQLSARVAQMLGALGAEVILTRGPHDGSSDSGRARVANDFAADLVLSIHLNSHTSEIAEGAATYFFEHEGVGSEPGQHLAELIQAELVAAGRADCRSHGRTYPILRETRMPAVLVEPGFVTNPQEAKLLGDPGGLTEFAAAVTNAVAAYFP